MNFYQITTHLSPNLDKQEIKNLQEDIKSMLTASEGEMVSSNTLEKVRLEFPIKDFNQTLLWDFDIQIKSSKINQLTEQLKEKQEILRMMVKKKPKEEVNKEQKERESKKKRQENKTEQTSKESEDKEDKKETKKNAEEDKKTSQKEESQQEQKKEDKVELDSIDDKLDQILEDEM